MVEHVTQSDFQKGDTELTSKKDTNAKLRKLIKDDRECEDIRAVRCMYVDITELIVCVESLGYKFLTATQTIYNQVLCIFRKE